MFTGIVEECGTVLDVLKNGVSGSVQIQASTVLEGTKTGDSIAVNGVCLTVTKLTKSSFTADVMAETFRRTNLGNLGKNSRVNLERAMAADGRFGGHIVSGHIDGTGIISRIKEEGNAVWIYISAPQSILNLIVEKGSVAVDGISLTVAAVSDKEFAVSVIPHTRENTALSGKKTGAVVNLENDIIGKYVQKLTGTAQINESSETQSERDKKILDWLS
ncbi:MAG: riboflavin synthase [Treponema porcinum]|uniref:Riboflavin synthase n=1 Tax=Treponema porcinum TaxID=261392 RepID=A0A1T4JHM9_TREPO|nr:riboflavin synthase [Treponema porcinum]MCI5644732.1 riboflavin synthase [Treponema porcinum]MDD7126304.1 riboflavin synthase [Treponema porcinum]MDY5121942.1 riboflavin synthase [Treponema porcinum]MDY5453733.1 riboflavin synthase [Treponema porcinum]SJZ29666.1 riboflavin synthase alpha chain [Treponema porcinum]